MRRWSKTDLGVTPITGPTSYYLNAHETSILIALIKSVVVPRVMIEFGCNQGITAARVLEHVPSLQTYIGIDVPPDHETTLQCQRSEVPLYAAQAVDDERFYLLMRPSVSLSADDLEPCDAVFIDGDHSEAAVLHESRLARALVRPGGIICWHDFSNPAVEVTQALTSLEQEGWPINCVENSWLAFVRV
jgi:predicted O-methyltransferase YrrM